MRMVTRRAKLQTEQPEHAPARTRSAEDLYHERHNPRRWWGKRRKVVLLSQTASNVFQSLMLVGTCQRLGEEWQLFEDLGSRWDSLGDRCPPWMKSNGTNPKSINHRGVGISMHEIHSAEFRQDALYAAHQSTHLTQIDSMKKDLYSVTVPILQSPRPTPEAASSNLCPCPRARRSRSSAFTSTGA